MTIRLRSLALVLAVLAIAGDFETKAMLKRIKELFEPIPNGPTPPRLTHRLQIRAVVGFLQVLKTVRHRREA